MVGVIGSVLARGFTNKQVVQYLLRTFPQFAPQINKALKYGFTPDRIVQYLAEGRKGVTQENSPLTEHEQTRKSDKDQQKHLEKVLGGTGLGVAGLGVLGATGGIGAAAQGIQGLLGGGQTPNQPPNMPPGGPQAPQQPPPNMPQALPMPNPTQPINPQTIANPLGQQNPAQPAPAPVQAQAQAQAQQQPQQPPENPSNTIINPDELWNAVKKGVFKAPDPENSAFLKVARDIKKTGGLNSKEEFDKFNGVYEVLRKQGLPIPELAKQLFAAYDQISGANPQQNAQNQQKTTELGEKISQDDQTSPKVAVLPNGDLGTIKSMKGKVVKLDVDGKNKLMNASKIIQSPLPAKDLADLHDDLIKGMESETGEDVSRMVQWAGYNPDTNTLAFLPYDGSGYEYENITPEQKERLESVLSKRKTTGNNFIGGWEAGTKSPIGAAMSQLIREIQSERGGKGNEYSQKFETVYSAYEPGIKASKAKKKSKDKAESERKKEEKKKAKDEEKKEKRKKRT